MTTSLDLARTLYQRGTLSKTAAVETLRKRERLVRNAMHKQASRLFEGLIGLEKDAGLLDRIGTAVERIGGREPEKGFFGRMADNLRTGGFTPGKKGGPGWHDVAANLAKLLGLAGLTAGATAGASALLKHRRDSSLQGDIENSYKQMFDEFPRLNEMDQDKVRTHFGVLAKYAPSLAADPTVAGSWVQASATMGTVDPGMIKNLAETQRRIDEVHEGHTPFSSHLERGLNVAGKAINPFGGAK